MRMLSSRLVGNELGPGFVLYLLVWTALAFALLFFWNEIPTFVRWPASLIEALAAPDLSAFRDLFKRKRD